ncbi:MAG: hypothetical protein HY681_11095 [Chloroflexi bacterium]|nr:hypothetical protein [Chloroflexota bacterium]
MDTDFDIDATELTRALRSAEVISILFTLVGKSLVIDTRANEKEGPMVRVLPQAGSLEERARSVRRLRPGFPRPAEITAFSWPKYVRSLLQTNAFSIIQARLQAAGAPHALRQLAKSLDDLQKMERRELAAVLQGERYHTIWSSRR